MLKTSQLRMSRRKLLESSLASSTAAVTLPFLGRMNAASARSNAATPAPDDDADALFAELENHIVTRMAELKIPGVAVGVIVGNHEHAATFGVTNVDHPLPVDTNTLFQIGSTTKTFTATALMHLIEQGKLDLEAPVQTYLPNFRVADKTVSEEVRLRHLVTHTAGWYDNALIEMGDGDDALALLVAAMADSPQVTPLGEFFSYNNAAVCLAGRVIEAVTGQTYEAAVQELILEPLGMEQASFFPEEIMTSAFAVGHGTTPDNPDGKPVVLEPWALPRSANPAGGLISSVNDQLRYAHFHLGDVKASESSVLSADGLRRMRKPLGPGGTTPQQVVDAVGVNWMLQNRGGVRVVSHPGGTTGQQSNFTLVPEHHFAITVLTNAQIGAMFDIEVTDWALERFLSLTQPAKTPLSLPPARLSEYVGQYILPANRGTIRIADQDGLLHLTLLSTDPTIPEAESPLRFVANDLALFDYMGLTLYTDFVRDDSGKVAWIRFLGRMTPRAA